MILEVRSCIRSILLAEYPSIHHDRVEVYVNTVLFSSHVRRDEYRMFPVLVL